MKKHLLKFSIIIISLTFIFGCAGPQTIVTFQPGKIPAQQYSPKVDNFMILFDSSSSMGMIYDGMEKLSIARAVVQSMNLTLPELNFTSGMRTFGHCSSVSDKPTLLVYGLTKYSTEGLKAAVDGVTCAGGTTPLGSAITEAHIDLKSVNGKTALIIVSDGKDLLHDPKAALHEMTSELGDRLCVYTILIGNDPQGAKNLEQMAGATNCGLATTADFLASADNMADFVKQVFLTPAPAPMPIAKPTEQPIMDSDGDGVPDHLDKCPGTPKGAPVNEEGCWIIGKIHFDFDQAVIRPDAKPVLNEITTVMLKNSNLNMDIKGFTDNIGSMIYNQRLSERRAEAAKNHLVNQGIEKGRFTINGFSYTMPISPNDTPEGRAMNRRVEFVPFE